MQVGLKPRVVTALALTPLVLGCATIVTGTTETVRVDSVPRGATVRITPGPYEITTPASLELRRGDAPYTLTAELEGYETQRSYIRGRANGWIWGNILLGGVPGIMVDWVTGALADLDPNEIELTLEKTVEANRE